MKRIIIRAALTAFIISVIWTLIEHFLGLNTTNHQAGQYTRQLPAFVFWGYVVYAIWKRRKVQCNELSFGQGFRTGASVSLLYSAFITPWYALYGEIINKDYKPTLMAFERQKLEAAHASAMEIADKVKEVDMTTGGSITSYLFLFVFMSVMGMVVGTIATFVMMRKKKISIR